MLWLAVRNMSKYLLSILLALFAVLISSASQILLKKSANNTYDKKIYEYLNVLVITAYFIFFAAMLINVFVLRTVPMNAMPVIETTGYLYVAVLSRILLKEKISKKSIIGLGIILVGIVVFFI